VGYARCTVLTGRTASAPDGPVDVTKPDTVRAAFEHSVREYGRPPDVVYANAGVSGDDYFEKDREVGRYIWQFIKSKH